MDMSIRARLNRDHEKKNLNDTRAYRSVIAVDNLPLLTRVLPLPLPQCRSLPFGYIILRISTLKRDVSFYFYTQVFFTIAFILKIYFKLVFTVALIDTWPANLLIASLTNHNKRPTISHFNTDNLIEFIRVKQESLQPADNGCPDHSWDSKKSSPVDDLT